MSEPVLQLQSVEIRGAIHRLHCVTTSPDAAWARLLIVHGYGEHAGRYADLMRWLGERGVAVEAIDLRGHGKSTGRRGHVSRWEEYLDDLGAFLQRHERGTLPLFVMGHSHGGLIVAAAAERGILAAPAIRGCVLSSPYLGSLLKTPAWKLLIARAANHLAPAMGVATGLAAEMITSDPAMREQDKADTLMNRIATPRWYFSTVATQKQVIAEAARFRLPLLTLIGDADVIADPTVVAGFYQAASSPDKTLYRYANRVHELFREVGREQVYRDLHGWLAARAK